MDFKTFLTTKKTLLLDGAWGSNLFKQGLPVGHPPELWNVENPQAVAELAQAFMNAGSGLVLTNTFGANPLRLKLHQAADRCAEINQAAVAILKPLAEAAGVYMGGSIGPLGSILVQEGGTLDKDEGYQAFCQQVDSLASAGVSVLWIETLSSLLELELAVKACQRTNLPVAATMSFDTQGRTMMGVTPRQLVASAEKLGLQAVGMNCGASLADSVLTMALLVKDNPTRIPLIAKANCGVPQYQNGEIVYSVTPALMQQYVQAAAAIGVRLIGGCCGTTPDHLADMAKGLKNDLYPDQLVLTAQAIQEQFGEIGANHRRLLDPVS